MIKNWRVKVKNKSKLPLDTKTSNVYLAVQWRGRFAQLPMTQAFNKVASRCLVLHPVTSTVRIPGKKTRYTKHERTPIYFHCGTLGVNQRVWREERRCNGRSKCWLYEHDMTQKTRSHVVHVIITVCVHAMYWTIHYKRCQKLSNHLSFTASLREKMQEVATALWPRHDYHLLLKKGNAVGARKPKTSAGV